MAGKCLVVSGNTQEAHKVFLESVSLLVSRRTICQSEDLISLDLLGTLIKQNVTADVFTVEQATIFYMFCWLLLKESSENGTRYLLIRPIRS